MMKYSLAALALVATTTFASAEPMDHSSGSSSGSAMERAPGQTKEPGSSAKESAPGQMKSEGSAKSYAPGQTKSDSSADRRSENDKSKNSSEKSAEKNGSKSSDADRNATNDKSRDESSKSDRNASRDEKSSNRNASTEKGSKTDRDASRDEKGSDRNATNDKLENRERGSTGASEGAEGRTGGGKGQITGVTEEQRTRVRSVFSEHRVEPARNLNVSVNVGVAIPRTVHLYPVPEQVVTIVPEYRGYDYILLEDGRIAIIDPSSYEVVDIIVVT